MSPQLPAKKRSSSVPRGTSYYAHAHTYAATTQKREHADCNVGTTYSSQSKKRSLIEKLRLELKVHHIDISEMVLERFAGIFPDTNATRKQLEALQMLYVQPMLVNNMELEQIMHLETPNGAMITQPRLARREHTFYIRSWTMTARQLYSVSMYMQGNGRDFPELNDWKFISFMAGTRNVTVRYVGSTNCLTTASRRFTDDTNNKSKRSLLGAFQNCLEELYPLIPQSAQIHLLPDLSFEILGSENHIGNQLNSDDTESLLVQLFGSRTLLNLQLGGHHIRYLPSDEDDMAFRRLRTRYFEKIMRETSQFPESQWSGVTDSFATMLAKDSRPGGAMSEAAKGALESQAKPLQYLGTTVVVFIGEELTNSHLKVGCSFFNGTSKSSRLVRNLIYRIKHIEESNFVGDDLAPLQELSRAFPFLNVFPLPKYRDKVQALDLLSVYFRCTRPTIVVTFDKVAASAMVFNLTRVSAKSRLVRSFLDLGVHELAISSYGSDVDDAFIHVPLEHPGSHQYGPRSSARLHFYYLTMQFAFFVASCAIEIIDTYSRCTSMFSRHELCAQILACVEKELRSGAGSFFRSKMIQAGKAAQNPGKPDIRIQTDVFKFLHVQCKEWYKDITAQTAFYDSTPRIQGSIRPAVTICPSDFCTTAIFGKRNGIEILDEQTFSHISSFGLALGHAYSEERRQDLDRVWARAHKELHWSIPHSKDMRDIWMEQFTSLQPGQPYFLRALNQLTDDEYLQALIHTCQKKRWHSALPIEKFARGELSQGVLECGFWLQRQDIRKGATLFPNRFMAAKEMQGYPIAVKDDGTFVLRWKQKDHFTVRPICRPKRKSRRQGPLLYGEWDRHR